MTAARRLLPTAMRWGADGLVPAVVQDPADGRVLMVAWMDAEALEATQSSGLVHFHSRSRNELWQKGATSGHVLHLRDLALDCDADTLLVSASPDGPVCHRGTETCFDQARGAAAAVERGEGNERSVVAPRPSSQGFEWLEELWTTILERATARPAGSYTVRLIDGGPDMVGRKVAEEAVELLIAAKNDALAERDAPAQTGPAEWRGQAGTRDALSGEAADLVYHLLVLLAERGLAPSEVLGTLRERHRG